MLKTISAALVAVSVLAAPALAGTPGKTAQAPVNKTMQAPAVKAEQGKAKVLAQELLARKLLIQYEDHRRVMVPHAEVLSIINQASPRQRRENDDETEEDR